MKVLITGTSSGIGKATAELFIKEGFDVIGYDIKEPSIKNEHYKHYIIDVSKKEQLLDLDDLDYLINNAGTVNEDEALATNIVGYINVAEKYKDLPSLKSILNIGSLSAFEGLDEPFYCASQGARVAYTKNLANRVSKERHIPVNLLCFGPTLTGLEPHLYIHTDLLEKVAKENLLNRWITPEEAAEWVYFMSVKNKSMVGQCPLVDAGELAKRNWIHVEEKK